MAVSTPDLHQQQPRSTVLVAATPGAPAAVISSSSSSSSSYRHQQQQQVMTTSIDGGGMVRRFRNPNQYDVLSGRGGNVNKHFGNIYFREIVKNRKVEYNRAKKDRKTEICREVMAKVAQQGGTFLVKENENSSNSFWTEQSDDRTMAKVSQALREGAPKIRQSAVAVVRAPPVNTTTNTAAAAAGTSSTGHTTTAPVVVSTSGAAATTGTTRKRDHTSQETSIPTTETTNGDGIPNKRVRVDCSLNPSSTNSGKQVHLAMTTPSEVTPPLKTATAPVSTRMPPLSLSSSFSSSGHKSTTVPRSESCMSFSMADIVFSDGLDIDTFFEQPQPEEDNDYTNPFGWLSEQPSCTTVLSPPPSKNTTVVASSSQWPQPLPRPAQRNHSLCLSDINAHPNYLEADFINPFDHENDDDINNRYDTTNNNGQHHHHPQSPPPPHSTGLTRQTSDMGGLGRLWRNNDEEQDQQQKQQQQQTSLWAAERENNHDSPSSHFSSSLLLGHHHPLSAATLIAP